MKNKGGKQRTNLIGKKFNRWLVLEDKANNKSGHSQWLCRCECGNEKIIAGYSLTQNTSKSCGCYSKETSSINGKKRLQDFINKQFGAWTVLSRGENRGSCTTWRCKCQCGNESIVQAGNLTSGQSTSCGACYYKRSNKKRYRTDSRSKNVDKAKYSLWRKQVYKRDKFTCVCCGKKGRPLNAHHIDSFNWAEEKRYDVNNGVTLCSGPNFCHEQFHQKYGCGNNTKKQFENFMENQGETKDVSDNTK